jgi:hypothetical protein
VLAGRINKLVTVMERKTPTTSINYIQESIIP